MMALRRRGGLALLQKSVAAPQSITMGAVRAFAAWPSSAHSSITASSRASSHSNSRTPFSLAAVCIASMPFLFAIRYQENKPAAQTEAAKSSTQTRTQTLPPSTKAGTGDDLLRPTAPIPHPPGSAAPSTSTRGIGRYFIADAVEAAAPAVTNIAVHHHVMGRLTAMGSGSGFIISEDGLIVTNAHVISNPLSHHHPTNNNIIITLTDGRKFAATVHSIDQKTDVALLQAHTHGHKLPIAKIGHSSALRPGEFVVALGSPQGLANTVTLGIVSAVARLGSELGITHQRSEYIQTDAAINQGNSGGPLINLDGEVIGINSLKLNYTDGIGFAIPIDIAWQIIQQLKTHKKVNRPYIGLSFKLVALENPTHPHPHPPTSKSPLPPLTTNPPQGEPGEGLHPHDDTQTHTHTDTPDIGMMVLDVKKGSPAEKAGLEEGDVVVEIEGVKVQSMHDMSDVIGLEPSKSFQVKVRRGGKEKVVTMTSEAERVKI